MTQHPEDAQPGRVTELGKQIGNDAELPGPGQRLLQKYPVAETAVTGQGGMIIIHVGNLRNIPFGSIFLPNGRERGEGLALPPGEQYTARRTNKQVFNC